MRKLALSIKAREAAEEKQAMAEFGSSDSGASLGDILGAALSAKRDGDADNNLQVPLACQGPVDSSVGWPFGVTGLPIETNRLKPYFLAKN